MRFLKSISAKQIDSIQGIPVCYNRDNTFLMKIEENTIIELKMQTDYSLNTEVEYVGKIAYLEHSEYIVWYQFE